MSRMKILLFNLHYSPNLGDGLIGACMIHGLGRLAPGARVVPVDISGRAGFGAVTVRNRSLALKALHLMPPGLRRKVVHRRLNALLDGVEPGWRAAVEDADIALIGGGQLFSDADLNFPTKIARVTGVLREAGLPVAIHAVGVARNWSGQGGDLFRSVFETDLRAVALRDERSRAAWCDQAGDRGPAPTLARDPGLLASEAFGPVPEKDRVALGITAPELLSYHADSGVVGGGGLDFFESLALALNARVGKVRLFCNGAQEDAVALARLTERPAIRAAIAAGRIEAAPVPRTAEELVSTVAPCRAVVSHRLHACILGYSYRRPVVGMGWDRKVESFFASVGLERFFVGRTAIPAGEVAGLVRQALDAGIDKATHRAALKEAGAALETTFDALTARRLRVCATA